MPRIDPPPAVAAVPRRRCPAAGRRAAVWLALAAVLLLPASLPAQQPTQDYQLSAGDRVRIAVFGEPDLSVTVRIDGSGNISYPLLGELSVAGLTSKGLETLIADRLRGPYLVDPKVTVSIEEYREFFIMGQVNRPGSYPYVPGLTVRRAISIAGGFTDIAARGKLFLISERSPQQERRVRPETPVGPGDTVIVKESLF